MGRRTTSEPNLAKTNGEQDFDSMSQAKETTRSVNICLKIAEDIRGDASKTLETLRAQGEQIHRTHVMAADMGKDLSKGEKLLNSLAGMFSMPWKPKKRKAITCPQTSKDDNEVPKRATKEQRQELDVDGKGRGSRTPNQEPANALHLEKAKQDDGLEGNGC